MGNYDQRLTILDNTYYKWSMYGKQKNVRTINVKPLLLNISNKQFLLMLKLDGVLMDKIWNHINFNQLKDL
jgi:hypothetical protein